MSVMLGTASMEGGSGIHREGGQGRGYHTSFHQVLGLKSGTEAGKVKQGVEHLQRGGPPGGGRRGTQRIRERERRIEKVSHAPQRLWTGRCKLVKDAETLPQMSWETRPGSGEREREGKGEREREGERGRGRK